MECNHCVKCKIDMGPNNPRQFCGKTTCSRKTDDDSSIAEFISVSSRDESESINSSYSLCSSSYDENEESAPSVSSVEEDDDDEEDVDKIINTYIKEQKRLKRTIDTLLDNIHEKDREIARLNKKLCLNKS